MPTISFNVEKYEMELIKKICERVDDFPVICAMQDKIVWLMDLTACHANGCRINLIKLLKAPDFDFAHDICGIRKNINRQTGVIENCFLPRCAA